MTAAPRRFGGGVSLFPLGVLIAIELLDQATTSAFNVLIPDVRDAFHLTDAGILLIVAIAGAAALGCTVPVAILADRFARVRIVLVGAVVGAAFSVGLGLAPGVVVATVMLAGLSMGNAVIFPTHNSLLADYYPVPARQRVYSAHRAGVSAGVITGVLLGAGLAAVWSWRAPFLFLAAPIAVAVVVATGLREPRRGRHEQISLAEQMAASERGEPAALDGPVTPPGHTGPGAGGLGAGGLGAGGPGAGGLGAGESGAGGLGAAVPDLDKLPAEPPPSFGEAWRTVWKIGALRRIFVALPFLAAAIVGFASLASLQYQQTFHLDATTRAFILAPIQVFDLLGLAVGAVVATRLAARGMRAVFRMLAVAAAVASGFAVLFALAPTVPVAFVGNAGIDASLAVVGPGVLAALSLAIPARVRSVGFSIGAIFVLPGLVVLPAVGALGDAVGLRFGLLLMVPVFVVGGLVVASAGAPLERDIRNVWISLRARAQMLLDRQQGLLPLLAVRDLAVGYDGVPVLESVEIHVGQGEIVALLGTNGAGKSTLLRAVGGVVEADHGAVVFDGRDVTHMPPHEIARMGVAQVPGGDGVFPTLTVEENLAAAAWQAPRRGARPEGTDLLERALADFPTLVPHRAQRAGNLSGGQQQMLALAMAMLSRPRLLLIDELSLGLAPIVVERLLQTIRDLRRRGTAVLLVEQSVNVAMAVADRAYVMEGGAIRASGTAAEITAQPELLRSIYLRQAARSITASAAAPAGAAAPMTPGSRTSAAPGPPALAVREVSVRFGGNAALEDVTIEAAPGETLGVIGPNGAGKTTLFDVISGFLRPAGGRVELHGRDVTRRTAAARARLGLGRSFQDSRLFSGLTVREALAVALERFTDVADPLNAVLRLPLQQRTEAAVAGRVDELLGQFGLSRFADLLVSQLSTGSRRLVDLAAVVAHQPSVILLDEPSSGVAVREVEAMGDLLRQVRAQLGATMLVVEHDIAFIASLADRLVVLDQGGVLAHGRPPEVLADPLVVEAFLGTRPRARSGAGPGPAPRENGEHP